MRYGVMGPRGFLGLPQRDRARLSALVRERFATLGGLRPGSPSRGARADLRSRTERHAVLGRSAAFDVSNSAPLSHVTRGRFPPRRRRVA